jgi:hypothetical protein
LLLQLIVRPSCDRIHNYNRTEFFAIFTGADFMPTSLPISYSTKTVDRAKFTDAQCAVWLIAIWAAVMLLSGTFAISDAEQREIDPFQLFATF